MDKKEIALEILRKMMDQNFSPQLNPEFIDPGTQQFDPKKIAECYNKIFTNLKTSD
ncbi:MAG: hypothetical protein JRJ77_03940 [Deltaproteobacteria bacterium]|nr:hypothetical protein [Deltaproteobacteria bacterium]